MFVTFGPGILPLGICPKEIIRRTNKNLWIKMSIITSCKTTKELRKLTQKTGIPVLNYGTLIRWTALQLLTIISKKNSQGQMKRFKRQQNQDIKF